MYFKGNILTQMLRYKAFESHKQLQQSPSDFLLLMTIIGTIVGSPNFFLIFVILVWIKKNKVSYQSNNCVEILDFKKFIRTLLRYSSSNKLISRCFFGLNSLIIFRFFKFLHDCATTLRKYCFSWNSSWDSVISFSFLLFFDIWVQQQVVSY